MASIIRSYNKFTSYSLLQIQKMIKAISKFASPLLISRLAASFATDSGKSTKSVSVQAADTLKSSFAEYAYTPSVPEDRLLTEAEVHQQADKIYKWALEKGADHYTFISYPHTSSICEKQESFINLGYVKDDKSFRNIVNYQFAGKTLIKGQGDGSSFPSGGLRHTHTARGYTIWDPLSQLYIRKQHKMLYIPSLLVSHYGHALDDKTLFRQSQLLLKKNSLNLLSKLGIKTQSVLMLLGLQQQFFAISKSSFYLRPDIRLLGRSLVGNVPARNQQFGEHYYGKMNTKVQRAIQEIEEEAIEIGIPFKTKHNEVALNQFEVCSICDQAGRSIDQNMILMQIMKQTFEKHGLAVLLHEKPFRDINGSGKHANWSLNYVKEDGSLKNLFSVSAKDTPKDIQIFKLFILLNLRAVLRNHKLYLTAIATPGNEIRLGGHQAPPRIISVFLGTALSNFLDGKQPVTQQNLQEIISFLNFQVMQENTDRNRTSPYAYTGNRFEFRAVGSSQNPSFAMAVIAATLANQIAIASARLEKGESLPDLIEDLRVQTQAIRFEGDGYSQEWKVQAKKRGLYVNENFSQIFQNLETEQKIFEELNICSSSQIKSRTQVTKNNYEQTVLTESDVFLQICHKHVIPEAFNYLRLLQGDFQNNVLHGYAHQIKTLLQNVIIAVNKIKGLKSGKLSTLADYQHLRNQIEESSKTINALIACLPKNNGFPDLCEILNM